MPHRPHWNPVMPKADLTDDIHELIAELGKDPSEMLKHPQRVARDDLSMLARVLGEIKRLHARTVTDLSKENAELRERLNLHSRDRNLILDAFKAAAPEAARKAKSDSDQRITSDPKYRGDQSPDGVVVTGPTGTLHELLTDAIEIIPAAAGMIENLSGDEDDVLLDLADRFRTALAALNNQTTAVKPEV